MKVLFCLVALIAVTLAQRPSERKIPYEAIKDMLPENVMGQECMDIHKACLGAATDRMQKLQCWVQFGICFGTRALGCYKKCVPPMQACQVAAGKDWLKIFQCGAAYIKCVTQDCE